MIRSEAKAHLLKRAYDGLKTGGPFPKAEHHPNGFICVTFEPTDVNVDQNRLHIWLEPVSDSDVHDHAWDFESLALFGKATIQKFILTDAIRGAPFHHYNCSKPNGTAVILNYRGMQHLALSETLPIHEGNRYKMTARELHSVTIRDEGRGAIKAATLITRKPYQRDSTNVYISSPLPPEPQRPIDRSNRAVSLERVNEQVKACLKKIERIL